MTTLFAGTAGPVPAGTRITGAFGYNENYPGNDEHVHYGVDFGVVTGTPVTATPEVSTVYLAKLNGGYGNCVILRYSDGFGIDWYVLHGHLDTIQVTVGQTIVRGMVIGRSGNTGWSFGAHLHFARGLAPAGQWQDPMHWLLSLEEDELTPEERALLDWLAANKSALSPLAIAAREAGFDAGHDTPATNDAVSRGIRRVTKLLAAGQLTEAQIRTMADGSLKALVLDLINVEVPWWQGKSETR